MHVFRSQISSILWKDRRQGSLRMPESRNSNSTLSERHAVGKNVA